MGTTTNLAPASESGVDNRNAGYSEIIRTLLTFPKTLNEIFEIFLSFGGNSLCNCLIYILRIQLEVCVRR